jgi:uncharacterized protein GlcG (DUF336 family)
MPQWRRRKRWACRNAFPSSIAAVTCWRSAAWTAPFSQSIDTSLMKAMTAASYGIPTGDIAAGIDLKLAIATHGKRINLPGGLPIIVDGHVIGGIGVGSGTGEQDKQVANASLGALSGARTF